MRQIYRKRLGRALLALSTLLAIWGVSQPLPFIIVSPGIAFNVLGSYEGKDVITVDGGSESESVGKLDLLTIRAVGSPDGGPNLVDVILAYFSSDKIILPMAALYPDDKPKEEIDAEQLEYFETSKAAALAAARSMVPAEYQRLEVTVKLGDVGGPSGGLVLALGIIDKLTPGQLTGGKEIAGTGTITADGLVGEIGGIRQKLLSAFRSGDRYILIPVANCKDVVGNVPAGLQVVPVSTLTEALNAVKTIASDGDVNELGVCSLK